jgi:RecA/RadA recombinase
VLGRVRSGSLTTDLAREDLMMAVGGAEMLAQVRTFLNEVGQNRFGQDYSVTGTPGLSEVYDDVNRVPTGVAIALDELLGRFDGASIGVAGPRGSGKTMLVHQYCDPDSGTSADLRCLAAAPVDYAARDFVLHLFAEFCRAVTGTYALSPARRLRRAALLLPVLVLAGAAAAALLYWEPSVAHALKVPRTWVEYAAIAVSGAGLAGFGLWSLRGRAEPPLAAAARKHLESVRYLQTFTSGWSGTLNLAGGSTSGQYSRSIARAEQPLSYPEIVGEFRNFARDVARDMHHRGGRVFIGVDELDKIGSAEQAEHFLNEIKGIFGIPHLYFMVSVSDDALTAFERRGLPLRDAFDSSFDEIVHVGPLSYLESRRLLYRRVIGLSEPYVALCHCLAGGLARDVIRAARQVVRAAAALTLPALEQPLPDPASVSFRAAAAYVAMHPGVRPPPSPTLADISTAVIQDEMRRKLRAVSQVTSSVTKAGAAHLHATLFEAGQAIDRGEPPLSIVDLLTRPCPREPAAVRDLRLDFAAYSYFCATLYEVFSEQINREAMIRATGATPGPGAGPGSFDALAAARNAFARDTHLAWHLISGFRHEWSLKTRELDAARARQTARRPARRR